MQRLLREPLVHFLVLGALLFAGYGVLNRNSAPAGEQVVITRGKIESLRSSFSRVWQRPPSAAELDGLVQDNIREEVFAREAIALGLDRDDTIIRRRLRQKMEFISDDIAAQTQPTDDELNAYLQAHPDQFRVEQQFTFRQLYLSPETHGENLARDTVQLLARLNQPAGDTSFAAMGDPFMLDSSFTAVPAGEITKQFGGHFTAKLGGIAPGQWQGPVESGYGVHLVLVSERTEGRMPTLAEVRNAVHRELESARRKEANEVFYQDLLRRYTVTIENPEPGR